MSAVHSLAMFGGSEQTSGEYNARFEILRVKQETLKMEAMCSPIAVVMFTSRHGVSSQQTGLFNVMFEIC